MRDRIRFTPCVVAMLAVAMLTALTACSSSSSPHSGSAAETSTGSTSPSDTPSSKVPPSSPAAQIGAAGVDVCSLLSASQASSINSVTYDSAKPQSPQSGYDICTYHNSGQHSSPIDIQNLTVTVLSIPGCWSSLQSADGPGKGLTGLGDAAFGGSIGIDIEAGDRCITISGLTDAELLGHYDPDIAMAKIILAGLH